MGFHCFQSTVLLLSGNNGLPMLIIVPSLLTMSHAYHCTIIAYHVPRLGLTNDAKSLKPDNNSQTLQPTATGCVLNVQCSIKLSLQLMMTENIREMLL